MTTFGLLIIVLVVTSSIDASSPVTKVEAPERDIDEFASIKASRQKLLEEQRARALAREEKLQEQYDTASINSGSMQDIKKDVKEKRDVITPDISASQTSAQVQPQAQPLVATERKHTGQTVGLSNILFIAVVAGCSVAGLVGLVVAGVCWYRLQKNVKAASEAEYPAYGITGPTKERVQSPGDRKLAQSAQMYHYQHQKQQMIALEKANSEMKQDGSDEDSEEENEEGDYTVYECPGLAPTGEMEVKNPLFSEDTPVTPTMPGNK